MTGIQQAIASSGGSKSAYLYDIIQQLGLTTNLNVVLDVADSRSYDGTGQTWTDATGNGNNYFRGSSATVNTLDPTFNGSIGSPSESTYWSFNAGNQQHFQETASQTYADGWHQTGGAFTLVFIIYIGSLGVFNTIFNTFSNSVGDGILLFSQPTTGNLVLEHSITNASSATRTLTTAIAATTWSLLALSFDEASTTAITRVNSTTNTVTPTASTNTTPTSNPYYIARDANITFLSTNSRLMGMAAWSTALTDAQLAEIYTRVKARRCPSMP